MKALSGLFSRQRFVAHLGCIEGCLAYLGVDVSPAWLHGATGHAFVVNVAGDLCPSGPTAWHTRMLFDLAPNLGYASRGMSIWRSEAGETFPARQREAWDLVRSNIDRGVPCYGWQFEAPDYYVITGYDDVGYYYSGYGQETRGPLAWQKLGTWDVDLLEVYGVEPCSAAPDDVAVREALAMALRHAGNPPEWIGWRYRSGPAAFTVWAQALATGRAQHDGHVYNAQVWHECRVMAVAFLREAQARLPGRCDQLLDEAAGHYARSRDRLEAVLAMHPPRPEAERDWSARLRSPDAARVLREAGAAERAGLACLQEIVAALDG